MSKSLKIYPRVLLLFILLSGLPGVLAAEEYTSKGADTCLMCHKGGKWSVMSIFHFKHGSRTDPAAPFSNEQCESCHGPSNEHARARSKADVQVKRTFGDGAKASVAEQNGACLNCHKNHANLGWFGSAHERTDVACVSCHSIHQQRDPVFDSLEQQQVCFDCHPRKRSDVHKASGHPLRFGNMTCSDCHNVHDGNNEFLLKQENVNDNCYSCHAEKRGPFLWEHAPVTDSCTLCHRPHGSNQPAMLTRRPPLLCQQCHSAADHPGEAFTSDDMDVSNKQRYLLARSCMNCHSQVHGSNHPSGSTQIR
jgi:DmsE family decaheme c-type cytochrome